MNDNVIFAPDSSPADWFSAAIAHAGRSQFAEVDGVPIHYLCWGLDAVEKPALVFVHGYRAHARWWDFIAPFFADQYRIIALDLSGMGDSGHRDFYDGLTFANDIIGVIRHAGIGPATVIGHSLGGTRVLRAAVEAPELMDHLIIIDSYVRFGDGAIPDVAAPRLSAPPYADKAQALRRFRLMPSQPLALDYAVDFIAQHSLRQVEGGWQWKFDRRLPTVVLEPGEHELFARIEVPVDIVYGESSSVVDDAMMRQLLGLFRHGRGPVIIPDAFHHVMLSQPLALVSTLRALLAKSRSQNE